MSQKRLNRLIHTPEGQPESRRLPKRDQTNKLAKRTKHPLTPHPFKKLGGLAKNGVRAAQAAGEVCKDVVGPGTSR